MNIRKHITQIFKKNKDLHINFSNHYNRIHYLSTRELQEWKKSLINSITASLINELENFIVCHPFFYFKFVNNYLEWNRIEEFLLLYFTSKKNIKFEITELIEDFLWNNHEKVHIKQWKYNITKNELIFINNELKWDYLIRVKNNFIYSKNSNKNIFNWNFDITIDKSVEKFEIIKSNITWLLSFKFLNINLSQSTWLFELRNLVIDKLKINNFYNINTRFVISNCIIEYLEVVNCDFWKSTFNNISVQKIKINNTTINDCIFNWCSLPSKLENLWDDKKMKDNYRQLKFVMDKNWNHTEANKFFAKEMEYYEKTKKIDNSSILWLVQDLYLQKFSWEKAKEIGEIISLRFSGFINDYWNNWIRPLFLIFLLATLATLLDWISTLLSKWLESLTLISGWWESSADKFWKKIVYNFIWDLFTLLLCILLLFLDNKFWKIFNRWIINKILDRFVWFIILILLLFMLIYFLNTDFKILQFFSIYINPIGLLPEYSIINWEKIYIVYNWIELLAFVLYKILYGILLWHLIVAAKRTTKR